MRRWGSAAPWLFTAGFFLVWELLCRALDVDPYILPPPSLVFADSFRFRRALLSNSLQTLMTTLLGFGMSIVFGLALGLLVGVSKAIYKGLHPVMVGFNSVPKVAVVPVLVLSFGIGTIPAVLTAFLISFFPIVINVATGLATIEPELVDLLRSLGARRIDILSKVGIPRSMPYFFSSLKVAITLAFVGSVVSETVAANKGVGHVMLVAQANSEVPLVFGGLLCLSALGIGMYGVFALLEKRLASWAFRGEESARR